MMTQLCVNYSLHTLSGGGNAQQLYTCLANVSISGVATQGHAGARAPGTRGCAPATRGCAPATRGRAPPVQR